MRPKGNKEMKLSVNQLRRIIKEEAEAALGEGGKLERLKALVAEVEQLGSMASTTPNGPEVGGVFVNMDELRWTRVAVVRPGGGMIGLESGPGMGRDMSLAETDFMESFIEAPSKDYLYFPPGAPAKAAVSSLNRLSRLCKGI